MLALVSRPSQDVALGAVTIAFPGPPQRPPLLAHFCEGKQGRYVPFTRGSARTAGEAENTVRQLQRGRINLV